MSQTKIAIATLFTSVLVWACTAEPAKPNSGGDDETKSASSSSSSSSSSGSTTTPPSTPPGETPAEEDDDDDDAACYTQCKTANPNGAAVMEQVEAAWKACACNACAAQCAQSFCGAQGTDPAEGDACETCLEGAAQCEAQWDACESNAECVKYGECEAACDGDDTGNAQSAQNAQNAQNPRELARSADRRSRVYHRAR